MNADLQTAPARPHVEFVLLYTTAEEFRPTYRRGILDALAYPPGHTVEYSYRRKNLADDIVTAIEKQSLENLPGAIVFVDVLSSKTSDAVRYYPLRRVRLGAPDGATVGMAPRARVRLRLTLGDFITYDPGPDPDQDSAQWHAEVQAFDEARGFKGKTPHYFVIPARDTFGQVNPDQRTAWEDVVTAVSKSHQLRNCVFVRVPPLRRVKYSGFGRVVRLLLPSGATSQVKPTPSRDSVEYVLAPDSVYRLELSVFEPHLKSGGQTKIAIKSSSDEILQVDQPFQSMVAGTSEWAVHLATKRNLERDTGAITVEVTGPPGPGVNTPNPVLFVHIPVGWPLVIFFLLLVFFGVFLVSLDKDSMADVSKHPALYTALGRLSGSVSQMVQDVLTEISSDPALYAIFAKVGGSALLALAAWVGFRKLPSAIKG